jgi:hypothetical protein
VRRWPRGHSRPWWSTAAARIRADAGSAAAVQVDIAAVFRAAFPANAGLTTIGLGSRCRLCCGGYSYCSWMFVILIEIKIVRPTLP